MTDRSAGNSPVSGYDEKCELPYRQGLNAGELATVIRKTITGTFGIPDYVRVGRWIAGHHLRLANKRMAHRPSPRLSHHGGRTRTKVTIFVTNKNNRNLLELTIRSLAHYTSYPEYQIIVADNGSTDGSLEMLEGLRRWGWPIEVLSKPEGRPQHEWYDYMADVVDTPLWIGIHEDMMFLKHGWLEYLLDKMNQDDRILLLGGELFPTIGPFREPVSGKLVDSQEALSTWIFCARKTLRDHVGTSFAFYKESAREGGLEKVWDQGGKLMLDIQAGNYCFACMEKSYTSTFYHYANMTWAYDLGMAPARRLFKNYQRWDAMRRLKRFRRLGPKRMPLTNV